MPFIDSKVSVPMTKEQKDNIKSKLGQAISIVPGKSEHWLMVGFEDNYELYFQGNQDQPSAYIEVSVFGNLSDDTASKMTAELCKLYEQELKIPPNRVYIKYQECHKWGWNGGNF